MIKEKKSEEIVATSFNIPKVLRKRVKVYAVKNETTISKIVTKLLTEFLDRMEKEEGENKGE